MTLNAQTDAVLSEMTELMRPVVAMIEGHGVPTTRGRYDEYAAAISQIASRSPEPTKPVHYLGIGLALIRAGANRSGVLAALHMLGYLDTEP